MAYRGRHSEAAQRTAERRERENQAPRLRAAVPTLAKLDIEIDEQRGNGAAGSSTHIRRVVVESAPALFLLPCSHRDCTGGGYDITRPLLAALVRGEARHEGTMTCDGQLGQIPCGSVMRYTAVASYDKS